MNQADMTFDAKDVQDNKVMAALSYLGVLVFIPLLAKKDSKFCQAHAKQGLVTFIAAVLLGFIPFVGWALDMVVLVVNIIALVNALMGKFWKIPGAYDLSKKFNF
ncbi:MAG: hypothetical protein HYV33_05045 [Candidatus Kerfeldbacteria bacterium]|nr:hypothetical protein [Candidatus Kerfeldbacteria bacterium]